MVELASSNNEFSHCNDESILAARNQNKEQRVMLSTVFCLIGFGITAITCSAVFLYVGFLFLVDPGEDILKLRTPAVTPTAPALAIPLREVALPPTNDVRPVVTPTAPAPAVPLREVALPPTNDVPPVVTPTAPAPAIPEATPNYLASSSRLVAVYSQKARAKGVSYEQYRARMEYLQKQQAGIDLRLTDPNLSTAERSRLERQKAYWGRAIQQMLALL
jgi:hypothetical protein